MPAGSTFRGGAVFTLFNKGAYFWTSTSHKAGEFMAKRLAYFKYMHNDSLGIYSRFIAKENPYYSCRCVKYPKAKLVPKPKRYMVDERDGQQYGYVEIGNYYWMTENMRYKAVGSRWNANNPDTLYGRLYDYYGALEACPKGWRLSTNLAWFELETAVLDMARNEELNTDYFRGKKIKVLKSKNNWGIPGTDFWKLNFLPAGKATLEPDTFSLLNSDAFFWVYSVDTKQNIIMEYRQINNSETGIYRSKKINEEDIASEDAPYPFMSCRCIKRID